MATPYSAQPLRLILASASPRRSELLTQAGYTFTVDPAAINETRREDEPPHAYVLRLAEEKAQAVLARYLADAAANGPLIVLGADTCVVLGIDPGDAEEILGKPLDAADAERMLRLLSGRTHRVLTAIAAATQGGVISHVETTAVTFAPIPDAELAAYCATAEPLDKAGAYGIQGYAARWIPRIDGCYFNVMGLPIARSVELIQRAASLQNAVALESAGSASPTESV